LTCGRQRETLAEGGRVSDEGRADEERPSVLRLAKEGLDKSTKKYEGDGPKQHAFLICLLSIFESERNTALTAHKIRGRLRSRNTGQLAITSIKKI
jgi:hypothetical protein